MDCSNNAISTSVGFAWIISSFSTMTCLVGKGSGLESHFVEKVFPACKPGREKKNSRDQSSVSSTSGLIHRYALVVGDLIEGGNRSVPFQLFTAYPSIRSRFCGLSTSTSSNNQVVILLYDLECWFCRGEIFFTITVVKWSNFFERLSFCLFPVTAY